MSFKPLTEVKRRKVEDLATLKSKSTSESVQAGLDLVNEAKSFGLDLRSYLDLAVDVRASENADRFRDGEGLMNGYGAALSFLNLPVRDDFASGVTLDLAADTFQTYPGTRALFPPVIDDVVHWKYRQDNLENVAALVSNSRTISGNELQTTVIDDTAADYKGGTAVTELGRVRVKSIRSTEYSVKIWKHGYGYELSYEFQRRARIDMLVPYVNRAEREVEMSKVGVATNMLLNGDSIHAAAPVVTQSSLNTRAGVTATSGKISFQNLMVWLVDRAKAGVPVDTVVGNWDAYIQWLMMFALPTSDKTVTDASQLAATGFRIGGVPLINGTVNFALSTTAPANKLIGYSKGDTLEELVENGSQIQESERSILNQSITYVKTENTGYRLVFGDTRSVYDFGN